MPHFHAVVQYKNQTRKVVSIEARSLRGAIGYLGIWMIEQKDIKEYLSIVRANDCWDPNCKDNSIKGS